MFKCECGETKFKALIEGVAIIELEDENNLHVVKLIDEYTSVKEDKDQNNKQNIVCLKCNKEYSLEDIKKVPCKGCNKMFNPDELNEKELCSICNAMETRFANFDTQDYVARILEMEKQLQGIKNTSKTSKAAKEVKEEKQEVNTIEPKKDVLDEEFSKMNNEDSVKEENKETDKKELKEKVNKVATDFENSESVNSTNENGELMKEEIKDFTDVFSEVDTTDDDYQNPFDDDDINWKKVNSL